MSFFEQIIRFSSSPIEITQQHIKTANNKMRSHSILLNKITIAY